MISFDMAVKRLEGMGEERLAVLMSACETGQMDDGTWVNILTHIASTVPDAPFVKVMAALHVAWNMGMVTANLMRGEE